MNFFGQHDVSPFPQKQIGIVRMDELRRLREYLTMDVSLIALDIVQPEFLESRYDSLCFIFDCSFYCQLRHTWNGNGPGALGHRFLDRQ